MKKIFTSALAMFALVILVACGNKKPPETPPDPDPEVDEFWDKNGNGIPDWQEHEITLTYATWQYTQEDMRTIDCVMVEKFTEKYPNITVEMQVVAEDYDWDVAFMGLLEAENLPDVFLVQRLESFLPFHILADITEMYNHDPSTEFIFDSLKNHGVYNNRRYALPTFIYPYPFFVNLDLLDAANVDRPNYNWTYDQMEAIAKATTNASKKEYGLLDTNTYVRTLPKVLKMKEDPEVGKNWFAWTYDGQKFNFDDPVFQTAINRYTTGLDQKYIKRTFTTDELQELYANPDFKPQYGGKVAMWPDPTWRAKDYFEDMAFNWDVYPGPNGVTSGNTDIGGVSALSPHKHAAYQLLKFMTFGEDGLLTRFQIYEEEGQELFQQANNFPYPIVDYGIDGHGVNKVWEAIPYGEVAPGFASPEFLEGLRNGAYWANKEVVGWDAVDEAVKPYFTDVFYFRNTFATLRQTIQDAADLALEEAKNAMDDQLYG